MEIVFFLFLFFFFPLFFNAHRIRAQRSVMWIVKRQGFCVPRTQLFEPLSSLFSFRSLNSIGDRATLTFKPPPTRRRPPCVYYTLFKIVRVSLPPFSPSQQHSIFDRVRNVNPHNFHVKRSRDRNGSSLIAYTMHTKRRIGKREREREIKVS